MTHPTNSDVHALLRQHFAAFGEKVFQTLHPGREFTDNWHIHAICHALDGVAAGGERRLMINVPPRTLKSIITSVAWTAFLLGHNPGLEIAVVSHNNELAFDLSAKFRKVVETDWYKAAFAPYHLQRWDELASQQQLAVPYDSSGPRSFTALPDSMSSVARDLERVFSGPNLTSKIELATCKFSITFKAPIMKQVLSAGGWSDWMGSTTNGQKEVGQQTQIWTVDLEKYDPRLSQQVSVDGRVVLNQLPGHSFSFRNIVRRTDDPSENTDSIQAIGGFFFTGLDIQRVNSLLQELSDICSGRRKAPSPEAAPAANDTALPVEANCAAIENDIARLECYDTASGASSGRLPSAFSIEDARKLQGILTSTQGEAFSDSAEVDFADCRIRHKSIISAARSMTRTIFERTIDLRRMDTAKLRRTTIGRNSGIEITQPPAAFDQTASVRALIGGAIVRQERPQSGTEFFRTRDSLDADQAIGLLGRFAGFCRS